MSDDHSPAETDAVADAAIEMMEALKAENASLKEQVLRFAAEAENTKRRAEREANDARAYAIQKFARDLLGAADNLSRATAAAPANLDDPTVKNFVLGIEMTEKALQTAFESNGLKKIEPPRGEKFDPHKHQAMMEQAATDVAAGGVLQILQSGYELFGRIVRPAMVVVAAKGSGGDLATPPSEPVASNPYATGEPEEAGGAVDTKA